MGAITKERNRQGGGVWEDRDGSGVFNTNEFRESPLGQFIDSFWDMVWARNESIDKKVDELKEGYAEAEALWNEEVIEDHQSFEEEFQEMLREVDERNKAEAGAMDSDLLEYRKRYYEDLVRESLSEADVEEIRESRSEELIEEESERSSEIRERGGYRYRWGDRDKERRSLSFRDSQEEEMNEVDHAKETDDIDEIASRQRDALVQQEIDRLEALDKLREESEAQNETVELNPDPRLNDYERSRLKELDEIISSNNSDAEVSKAREEKDQIEFDASNRAELEDINESINFQNDYGDEVTESSNEPIDWTERIEQLYKEYESSEEAASNNNEIEEKPTILPEDQEDAAYETAESIANRVMEILEQSSLFNNEPVVNESDEDREARWQRDYDDWDESPGGGETGHEEALEFVQPEGESTNNNNEQTESDADTEADVAEEVSDQFEGIEGEVEDDSAAEVEDYSNEVNEFSEFSE